MEQQAREIFSQGEEAVILSLLALCKQLAERESRSAVTMRKNCYGNRSDQGADTQAILMSIFRTIKKRGHHPIQTIINALDTYIQTSQLPPLPAPNAKED